MDSNGAPMALVVSVQPAADSWQVTVDGPEPPLSATLVPARFVLRMWRGENGTLRGTIRRHGSDTVAPFQCNEQMQQFVTEWLWPE